MSEIHILHPQYQLKITLVGSNPPLWRRVIVPSEITLYNLHLVIQALLGWNSRFPQYFETARLKYVSAQPLGTLAPLHSKPLTEWPMFFCDLFAMSVLSLFRRIIPAAIDQRKVTLGKIMSEVGVPIHYYCLSYSSWRYELILEKFVSQSEGGEPPICIAGSGACPSEDVVALSAIEGTIEILHDQTHPQYNELVESYCGDFDCPAFNLAAVNSKLRQLNPTAYSIDCARSLVSN